MSEQIQANNSNQSPLEAMLQIVSGFWVSRMVHVALKLGIADLLREGSRTAEELAAETGTHAPSLHRVLRALAMVGVFRQEADHFGLTPLSATLLSDAPGSLHAFALVQTGDDHFAGWSNLMHAVKTGEIAFDALHGMNIWEFYDKNPENAQNFNTALANATTPINEAIAKAYDFSRVKKLVDVGGGHGSMIAAILKANPALQGVLFDAPSVVEGALKNLAEAGVENRCERIGGDFFQAVPEGADAYIMRMIIHDWDDERSLAILRNIHRAAPEKARLLIVESVVPENDEPHFAKFMDVNMLVMTGGRERTEAEYRELLARAGFKLNRVIQTESFMHIVEAERI